MISNIKIYVCIPISGSQVIQYIFLRLYISYEYNTYKL